MINLKLIRNIKPTRIKNIPKYEFKESSKLIITTDTYTSLLN